jgi:hypothetical protein
LDEAIRMGKSDNQEARRQKLGRFQVVDGDSIK